MEATAASRDRLDHWSRGWRITLLAVAITVATQLAYYRWWADSAAAVFGQFVAHHVVPAIICAILILVFSIGRRVPSACCWVAALALSQAVYAWIVVAWMLSGD